MLTNQNDLRKTVIAVQSEIASLKHSVNTLKNNTKDVYGILYMDKDAIIKRLEKVEEKLESIEAVNVFRRNLMYGLILAFLSRLIPNFIEFLQPINGSKSTEISLQS